jgi:HAMP domain-containing protein
MQTFTVAITDTPSGDLGPFIGALAQALNAQETQIAPLLELLRKGPVVVTRPIAEREAFQVVRQLENLGFKTQLRQAARAPTELDSAPEPISLPSDAPTANVDAGGVRVRRSSLRNRILLTTLLPLVALIVAVLGFTALNLPTTVRQLILEGADQLAIAVGNSIVLDDPAGENRRLLLITQQPKVFFVQVDLPDRSTLFRAKVTDDETVVRTPLSAFINANPAGGVYSWTDNRVEAFRAIEAQLRSSGQSTPASLKPIQDNIARTAASAGQVTNLEIRRIGFSDANGTRQVVPLESANFIVTVGVIANDSLNIRNNFLLVFGLVALLATGLIVAFMLAALQRVVQPILEMSRIADKISMGDIEQPVPAFANDELGDLAGSIERLRVSVKVLMDHMKKRP